MDHRLQLHSVVCHLQPSPSCYGDHPTLLQLDMIHIHLICPALTKYNFTYTLTLKATQRSQPPAKTFLESRVTFARYPLAQGSPYCKMVTTDTVKVILGFVTQGSSVSCSPPHFSWSRQHRCPFLLALDHLPAPSTGLTTPFLSPSVAAKVWKDPRDHQPHNAD